MRSIKIHPDDNVAVALEDMPGIPAGHKMALCDLHEGDQVIKYGMPIGHVVRDVKQGELIDHNVVRTNLSGTLDYSEQADKWRLSHADDAAAVTDGARHASDDSANNPQTFNGYLRPDGQVGIRNEVWLVPTVGCVDGIVRHVAERARRELFREGDGVDAIVAFPHNYGCSQLGDDHENTRRILRDMVHHPNAGGVLVIGLGCENNQPHLFREFCGDYDSERVRFMTCQEVEGDEEETAMQLLTELYQKACTFKRTPQPLSKLRVGLKCGGSDGFSGITANPLLGRFSDWLCTEQGGTTVLTEVPEMFGAETLLMQRCATQELLEQTIRLINDFKTYFLSHGQPVGENPSPGNKAGGISTLEEKALGCTQKSGSSPVCGVLPYGERIGEGRGLHLLSAPGNDLVASTALAAAGCQLVLFTTGRGTPFATFVPTVKVATNSHLAQTKPHWMDFDAGPLIRGVAMDELLRDFRSLVIDICEGRRTKSELRGGAEIAIFKNGVTL